MAVNHLGKLFKNETFRFKGKKIEYIVTNTVGKVYYRKYDQNDFFSKKEKSRIYSAPHSSKKVVFTF
jgi:hypothetical protein